MKYNNIIEQPAYHGQPIKAAPGYGVHSEILNTSEAILKDIENKHGKVFVLFVTLKFPSSHQYPPNNSNIHQFMNNMRCLWRSRRLANAYIWVREQSDSAACQHYHLCVLFDGNKTQRHHKHVEDMTRLWAAELGLPSAAGLVDCRCQIGWNAIMIRRGSDDYSDSYSRCFEHLSYFAKTSQKNTPTGVRGYGASRIMKQ